ncbi:MAG: TlpA family protein disulfide reductase [Deltaproteobacteria bacterium]|nr:TlpA family protein disulfide reductase [Deltaproteobacteria bacterium]
MSRCAVRVTPFRRRGVALLLSLCFLGIAATALPADKTVEVGHAVPDFSLSGLEGPKVSFRKDILGKAPLTLLFFMTTACSACYEELQEINEFVGENPGKVDVWCIAVDLRGAQTVGPFRQANKFRVKYLIDPKFSLPRTFGFNYTPSLAFVDSKGVLLHKKGGYTPNERLSDLIRTFLK